MATEILMPALSPTMEEGTLAKWLVKEGDEVSSGDILAEIETDKATMEFEAVDEGTIGKILIEEGTEGVKVNTPIAVLLEEGEDASAFARFMAAMAEAQDDHVDIDEGSEGALVRIADWRLMRGPERPHPAVFEAWNGLWEGCLAVHNRFLALEVLERLDYGDPAFIWRIRPRT